MTYEYPAAPQAAAYEELEAIAELLDAELAIFHTSVADPRRVPADLKPRLGGGFLVPWPPSVELSAADIEHFRRSLPARFAEVVAAWTRHTGEDEQALLQREEVRAAFAYCRMLQAWAPDLICVRYVNNQSVFGLLARYLLEIPLVAWSTRQGRPEDAEHLQGLLLEAASFVMAPSEGALAADLDRFGDWLQEKAMVTPQSVVGSAAVIGRLRRLCHASRSADAPPLGPRAAFTCEYHASVEPVQGVRPFLVLGTERTGSNLLVDVLAAQPLIACAGELFNPRAIDRGELTWLPEGDFDLDALMQERRESPATLQTHLLRDGGAQGAAWVGYKLLYLHGVLDNRVMRSLTSQDGIKVVHLRRRDRLRRWLSHYKAQVLDSWYTEKGTGQGVHRKSFELDAAEAAFDFVFVELLEDRFDATFPETDILELDYDDFTVDLPGTRKKLEAFFGLWLSELQPKSKKTGVASLAKGIANLGELQDAFRGTRWQALFDA